MFWRNKMPKVIPMLNEYGNVVKNQYTYHEDDCFIFQSYGDVIVKKDQGQIYMDINKFEGSVTTMRYRNQFLNMTDREVQESIDNGDILLVDLND